MDANQFPFEDQYVRFKQTFSSFDQIRLQSYRIATKLRHLQKESKFSLIDLYNTIEAFRDPSLTALANAAELIPVPEVHQLLCAIFGQLSRRLPPSQTVDIDHSVTVIFGWLLDTFQDAPEGFVRALALKTGLTILCSSLLSHKLKYLFTLLSNENGQLDEASFSRFMHYVADMGNYTEPEPIHPDDYLGKDDRIAPISLDQFLATFENSVGESKSWMIVYHRLADAETVLHQVRCDSCRRESFHGFRYKCKVCSNYNQCQECFLTGKSSKNHDPDRHECKEYLFDGPSNLRRSLRKSLRSSFRFRQNKPPQSPNIGSERKISADDNLITKKLNLSHIVSPQLSKRNKTGGGTPVEFRFDDLAVGGSPSEYSESYASWSDPTTSGGGLDTVITTTSTDGEHALIEFYLKLLKGDDRKPQIRYDAIGTNESFEQTIQELERKNCQLMKSITELKLQRQRQDQTSPETEKPAPNGTFFNELSSLRQKTADLECYLKRLQDKRKDLMFQLDDVMKELKQCNLGH